MKFPDEDIRKETVKSTGKRHFKLFLAGEEPNSRIAKENFEKIRALLDMPCELEIIDVLQDFRAALAHDILVTPTLVQKYPLPSITVMGNLSNIPRVLSALGVKAISDENR